MKIAAGRLFAERFREKAEAICPCIEWELFSKDDPWEPRNSEAAVLIGDAYTPEFKAALLKMPSLRWVHTENTGVDSEFYKELVQKGITLTRSPGANAPEVAEFIFSLMLNEVKQLANLKKQQGDHDWNRLTLGRLNEQTILIVGLGEIGTRVARIADTFGMHVLGLRRSDEPVSGVAEQGSLADLDALIPRADFIVLTVPLTPETKHLIGAKELTAMKDAAMLINIARGDVIDTNALKTSLTKRPSINACLDVMPEEPWPSNDELWDLENIFITPHNAWSSPAFRIRAGEMWMENLSRHIDGRELQHIVKY